MPGVCEIIINLLVISSIVVETVNAATIAEEERKWFLRALDEEQRYIRRELLTSAAGGDLPRLETALEDSSPSFAFGLDPNQHLGPE